MAQKLMVELASRGHEVTMVSTFPLEGQPPDRFQEVLIEPYQEAVEALSTFTGDENFLYHTVHSLNTMLRATNASLMDPAVQELMASDDFDLIVMDFIYTSFQQGLAAHFKCPYVILVSTPTGYMINEMVGQPNNPEGVSSFFTPYKGPMSMYQRGWNMLANVMEYFVSKLFDIRNAMWYP